MATPTIAKTERIDVRANLSGKQLLQDADRRRFELDEKQWQQFQQALDRPVSAPNKRMKALLTEPGVLD